MATEVAAAPVLGYHCFSLQKLESHVTDIPEAKKHI